MISLDELISSRLSVVLDERARAELVAIDSAGRSGLELARGGDLIAAASAFQRAADRLARAELTDEPRAVAQSLLCAQLAYLRFRVGRDEDAVALLERSLVLDLALEPLGYDALVIHRAQLVNNLMRLRARREDRVTAGMLGRALVAFLDRGEPHELRALAGVWGTGWSADRLERVPPSLVAAMRDQVSTELQGLER